MSKILMRQVLSICALATTVVMTGVQAETWASQSVDGSKGYPSDASSYLPKRYQEKPLVLATVASQPPDSYKDASGEPTGVDPDILKLIASKLSDDVKVVQAPWENILLGLNSGKYQAIADAALTPERAKKYDIIPFWNNSYGFAVKKGSKNVDGRLINELCGYSVGITAGNSNISKLKKQSDKCSSAGKKPLIVKTYPSATVIYQAVLAGRIDGWFGVYISQEYANRKQNSLDVVQLDWTVFKDGIMVTKDSGLGKAFAAALDEAIKDGSYKSVMEKYEIGNQAVRKAEINPLP